MNHLHEKIRRFARQAKSEGLDRDRMAPPLDPARKWFFDEWDQYKPARIKQ